jgi:hypothetical protein
MSSLLLQILTYETALSSHITPDQFSHFYHSSRLPFLFYNPTTLLPEMTSTNGLSTSASTFFELDALRPFVISDALQDAYIAMGHILGTTHTVRMASVLDVQSGAQRSADEWEILAGPGVTMIKSDLRRLVALKKSIDACISSNQEVLRSWNPQAAETLDDNPRSNEAILLGWKAPQSSSPDHW